MHLQHGSKNFDEFSLIVKNLISITQKNIDNNKNLEKITSEDQNGYARESINSFLIFEKKELMEGKLIEGFFLKRKRRKTFLKSLNYSQESLKNLITQNT